MSSSISSSNPVQGQPQNQAREQRKIFLRIFLTVLLGMGVAMVLVRAFTLTMGAGSQSLLGRVLEAQSALPQILQEEVDLVMVFGSSMVQAGFSPREFDQSMAEQGLEVKSFNFGFGGLNPLFQDYVSRRIAEEFENSNRRLALTVIEFNPFQTTHTRREGAVALEEAYIALLASDKEIFEIFLDDPGKALRMWQIRYLRDGISAEMATTFLWAEPFQAPAAQLDIEEDEAVEERLRELFPLLDERFEAEYPDYDGSDWYYPWQGGGTVASERAPETLELFDEYYELITAEHRMVRDRQRRIDRADIEQLRFDPELVEAFIRIVKNFQEISDHVEVIMLPKNTDWIKTSPEAIHRQAEVVAEISEATGISVRDFQVIDAVSNDMFSDTTHLNRYYGASAFTEFLVNEYARLLQKP